MEFGSVTIIFADTVYNNSRLFMRMEIKACLNSKILVTYDNDIDIIKDIDMSADYVIEGNYGNEYFIPNYFRFKTTVHRPVYFKDEAICNEKNYGLQSLNTIFEKHTNWVIHKASVFNSTFYIFKQLEKVYVFSILNIGNGRFLFAYDPEELDKPKVEQIIFYLFTSLMNFE